MKITANFVLEKTTAGAIRYQEVTAEGVPLKISDGAKIGTLYVRKSALDGDSPQKLTVTVETA